MSTNAEPSNFRVLTSAARTADNNTNYFQPPRGVVGVRVYIETTAASSPSTTFNLQVRDHLNNTYHTVLSSAAVTGTGRAYLEYAPGTTAVTNAAAGGNIGQGFRINCDHSGSNSHTYNIVGVWLASGT